MRIHVECRAERVDPLRFVLGETTIEVSDLLDRWWGDDADYFRVRGADGDLYVLKRLRGEGRWELTCFTRRGSCGTAVDEPAPHILH
jgi:hypothetical protein